MTATQTTAREATCDTPARCDETSCETNLRLNKQVHRLVKKSVDSGASADTYEPEITRMLELGKNTIVYEDRVRLVTAFVAASALYGLFQAPNAMVLLVGALVVYLYVDFYGGILHVVLDNPDFLRLPVVDKACLEFQWHHLIPTDIVQRSLFDVWGDLNVLLGCKTLFTMVLVSETAGLPPAMRAAMWMFLGLGGTMAFLNQVAHRQAHVNNADRAGWANALQQALIVVSPEQHSKHHKTHDTSFPVLSGWTASAVESMLEHIPDQYAWLGMFALLTVIDVPLAAFVVYSLV